MKCKALLAAAWISLAPALPAFAADAPEVELTWMSIANWYFKIGDLRIVLDGYITRLPGAPFFYASKNYPKGQYTYTRAPALVDVPAVTKVRDAMLGGAKLDYVLSGHSHWDHSWDTPTWTKLTSATMIGGLAPLTFLINF